MKIQDALARLERVGSETSKTTQKLRDAVRTTADKVAGILRDADLEPSSRAMACGSTSTHLELKVPTDTQSLAEWSGVENYWLYDGTLYFGDPCDSSHAEALSGDSGEIRRDVCLMFSRHISLGLLDMIADWLDRRTLSNQRAVNRLEVRG